LTTGRQQSPVKATNAHISKVGHITGEELRRYLSTTEAASGFGNRFLWLCVRRSKCLAEGGQFVDMARFVDRLREAIAFARSVGELEKDDEAKAIWREVYPSLSQGKPGLAGALIARGEAQTMRLACVYALLDKSDVIQSKHLQAALALWEYCERSVQFIFGDSLGDDVADEILAGTNRLDGSPGHLAPYSASVWRNTGPLIPEADPRNVGLLAMGLRKKRTKRSKGAYFA
jgi:hypothetical protein